MTFRKQNMMNFQIQLTKREDILPITRVYIECEERRLRNEEGGKWPTLRLHDQFDARLQE
jgi:cyclopropane-fatty-acyl-phospholipid synthase